MSITSSLSNAVSGLTAASRAAEVVSANVSNALTDGYGRRELELTSATLAGGGRGVRVVGVQRNVDQITIGERRLADANLGNLSAQTDFLKEMGRILGQPGTAGSLTSRLDDLEATLIEAASRPDSDARLTAVFNAARGLADHINQASDQIQGQRLKADQEIARQVSTLNAGLKNIANLNHDIRVQLGAGHDAAALMDQRQQQIDNIAPIVPLRMVDRDNGQIALFTPGGAILLDGKPAQIGFSGVGAIVPGMTLASTALSGLTVNGQPMTPGQRDGMAGGSLAGHFQIRDQLATTGQLQLDALARDLMERFSDPATDPTLAPGAPGLFTDAGIVFNPVNEVGLAGRLSINGIVNPGLGGVLTKLRDGLGSVVSGDPGNAAGLLALADALSNTRVPASGGFLGAARSAVGLAGDLLSLVNVDLAQSENDQSYAQAQSDALKTIELQSGVDTDYEMRRLLLIEQAYSANARVISTIDDLIQTLLGM